MKSKDQGETASLTNLWKKIKKIREQKGILQEEVATTAGTRASNYYKIEKGERTLHSKFLNPTP